MLTLSPDTCTVSPLIRVVTGAYCIVCATPKLSPNWGNLQNMGAFAFHTDSTETIF